MTFEKGKIKTRASDGTDNLFIRHNLAISVYHVPSDTEVAFKAFEVENSDSFTSDWSQEKVYGRQDPIVSFQGTERTISLSWMTAGFTDIECINNLGNVGLLISMLYPTYEIRDFPLGDIRAFEDATISAAPIIRLKFSNLISNSELSNNSYYTAKRDGQLGIIQNLSAEPDQDAGFVQISRGGLIPKSMKINLSFKVIHEHPVGWGADRGAVHFTTSDPENQQGAEFPYGAVGVERDVSKFEKDQNEDRFNNPNSYKRTRLKPPKNLVGKPLRFNLNQHGPEDSWAARTLRLFGK